MPNHPFSSRTVLALAALSLAPLLFAGCGGGSGGGGTTNPPPTTPDMGTLVAVSDNTQFKIKNASSSNVLGIASQSQTAGASLSQSADAGTSDQLWHFMPMGSNEYNIEDMLTHQVMGIASASTAAGALALQWADNGTNDHLWSFYQLTDGNYLVKNINSGLYLQVDTSSSPASIDQAARATTGTGCTCQEWALTDTGAAAYPAPLSVTGSGIFVHDPNMLQDPSGTFWLYGTHNTLASSPDMSTFTASANGDINPDFSWWASENTTGTAGRTDIWAPSVLYANGVYYQYYSIPIYTNPAVAGSNSGPEAVIALATSTSTSGPWVDAGKIISSCGTTSGCTTTFNAIDPAPFIDSSGNWWLSFGSWNDGIHILQLDPATGLRLASNSALYNIAARGAGEEGSFIYPAVVNGTQFFYYLASINVCCNGTASTYRIIVGRSTTPTGPFLDRGGLDLATGGGTILLSSHNNIYGPGGEGVTLVGTQPILVYHYYDGNTGGTPTLGLSKLYFDSSGWPYIQ
ncbi:MAG TPA: family 43 glycosylhydrolase [Acidobacteriaceae bacterium]|jgi:arabinan endo-1,5-alpha-L-arabinosidase|nr:family 43 glycosylhydrolase [Acidobacteriaceae bacterium]